MPFVLQINKENITSLGATDGEETALMISNYDGVKTTFNISAEKLAGYKKADIVLVDDEVKEITYLINLSKRMMTTIKFNLAFSMGLNFLAIALAVTEILNPVVGALVQ